MASRNERKRAAKAREQELRLAVEQAFAKEAQDKRDWTDACARYISRTQDALSSFRHRNPSQKTGQVIKGKLVSKSLALPAPRKLSFSQEQGKMIERRKKAI